MLDREQLRQTLVELLENEIGQKPRCVDDGVNLRAELGLDSVDMVGVVMQIENRFRIRLTHQELEKLASVGDFLDLIQAKLAAAPQVSAA
jgi:acyl carrier protein